MKIEKGQYGYIASQKKKRILITAILFGISLLIFITGLIQTKTRLNMFTFVSIMGCLPASRSCVGMIMIQMQKPVDKALYEKAEQRKGDISLQYELCFTTYQKTIAVACMLITDSQIIGYCADKKADLSFGETHLHEILCNNSCRTTSVKLLNSEKVFLERLEALSQKEQENKKISRIIAVLHAVSL